MLRQFVALRRTALLSTAAAMTAPPPVRPFCGCYLLKSCDPAHPRSSYIGFTVNPLRRVRQHNGGIQGGARRTRRHRPWEPVALVDGFASQVEALKFEWAWQHPEKSLAVRGALNGAKKRSSGWRSRLQLLETMCGGVDAWRDVTMRVCAADALPATAFWRSERVSVGALDAWPPAVAAARVVARRRVPDEVAACAACQQPCAPTATTGAFVACERCGAPTHLTCLAEQALRRRDAPECTLVPPAGACPVCDHESDWTLVVRAAKRSLREAARPPPPLVATPAPRRVRPPSPPPASDDDDVFDLTQATQETVMPEDDSESDDDVLDLCSPVPPAL